MHRLMERLERLGQPRVALVGDFILDRYVYGDAERINPEAPVPVLRCVRDEQRVGGAGNVAAAVSALAGQVRCIGLIGADEAGETLCDLLNRRGADVGTMVRDAARPTSVKTRFVGLAQHRHPQQMLRVDAECADGPGLAAAEDVTRAVADALDWADLLAIEDYDKGTLDDRQTPARIAQARRQGLPVLVDPACGVDYRRYRGATLLTPNRYEASLASGMEIDDDASLEAAARRLIDATSAEAMVITLDREGAYLLGPDGGVRVAHPRPRSVYDVSGAGDVVLAVLAVALAGGAELREAVELANVAGGLVVERFGFVPVTREEMLDELGRQVGLRGGKVLDRDALGRELARRRSGGQRVVLTNGCFDLLHTAHVRFLQQARQLGSCLVVAINSDDGVRRLKGPRRPVLSARQRCEVLAAMECVDYVTVFEEDTPEALLEALRPDVLVKGAATDEVVGRAIVEGYGGQVVTTPPVEAESTTEILGRIAAGGA